MLVTLGHDKSPPVQTQSMPGTKAVGGKQHDPTSMAMNRKSTEAWKQSILLCTSVTVSPTLTSPLSTGQEIGHNSYLSIKALYRHRRKILKKNLVFLCPKNDFSHELALQSLFLHVIWSLGMNTFRFW